MSVGNIRLRRIPRQTPARDDPNSTVAREAAYSRKLLHVEQVRGLGREGVPESMKILLPVGDGLCGCIATTQAP